MSSPLQLSKVVDNVSTDKLIWLLSSIKIGEKSSLQPSLSVTIKEYVPVESPVNSTIESDDWISLTLLNEYVNGLEFPDATTSILPRASPEHKLSVSTTEFICYRLI